jgi:hypothetical protein
MTQEQIDNLDKEKKKKLDKMNKDLEQIVNFSKLHIEKGSKYVVP